MFRMLSRSSRARFRALHARVVGLRRRAPAAGLLLLGALALMPLGRRPPPAPVEHTEPSKPLWTRSLYVAGHSRPHPELCRSRGERTRLVILVASAPAHASARAAVRLTWGHAAQRADVALAFVLGASPPALRAALDAEDALYGDLVEGRSVDSYNNLTLKTLSMLEWFDTYCPRARHLLKTDDDVFVNVPWLLKFLEDPARRNATNTVWGRMAKRTPPERLLRHKHYVPTEQFPGRMYPDYAQGPAYLVTADAARRLRRAAPSERYLRLEDVFVTGVLAARLGVRRVDVPELLTNWYRYYSCVMQRSFCFHQVRYHEQVDLWWYLHGREPESACSRAHRHQAVYEYVTSAALWSMWTTLHMNLFDVC